jgi:lipid-A-disaccharide synthase
LPGIGERNRKQALLDFMESIFVSTGCTSSDVLLAPVLAELRRRGHSGEMVGVGGTPLRDEGVRLLYETTPLASIGPFASFRALVRHGAETLRMYLQVKQHFRQCRPALAVLVDNPGLNLSLVSLARRFAIPVLFYAPPEMWSLTRWRARKLARQASAIACIFSSEGEAYRAWGGNVSSVGHPALDLLCNMIRPAAFNSNAPTIGLFPGSRRLEVQDLMSVLRDAAAIIHSQYPNARFIICSANEIAHHLIQQQLSAWSVPVTLLHQQAHAVLGQCDLLLTCSGTATLEAAILGVPMVVMYRLHYWVDRAIKRCVFGPRGSTFFSLPNRLLQRPVVPELENSSVNPQRLASEAFALLRDPVRRLAMTAGLAEVRDSLGQPGAIGRVANLIEQLVGLHSERPRSIKRMALTATHG